MVPEGYFMAGAMEWAMRMHPSLPDHAGPDNSKKIQ
jgi:hypothetical protein